MHAVLAHVLYAVEPLSVPDSSLHVVPDRECTFVYIHVHVHYGAHVHVIGAALRIEDAL